MSVSRRITNVSDTAYNATSWNGSTDPPTKNVVRDQLEAIGTVTSVYASGTAAEPSSTFALLNFGGQDPTLTLPATGRYLFHAGVKVDALGASGTTSCVFKLRKTNGTPADVANSSIPVVDASAGGASVVQHTINLPVVPFDGSSGDVISLFGQELNNAGVEVSVAWIVAQRIA